jgi:hypothetical protein
LAADLNKQGLGYFSFSLNELGIHDIPAQLDHLHTVKTREIMGSGLISIEAVAAAASKGRAGHAAALHLKKQLGDVPLQGTKGSAVAGWQAVTGALATAAMTRDQGSSKINKGVDGKLRRTCSDSGLDGLAAAGLSPGFAAAAAAAGKSNLAISATAPTTAATAVAASTEASGDVLQNTDATDSSKKTKAGVLRRLVQAVGGSSLKLQSKEVEGSDGGTTSAAVLPCSYDIQSMDDISDGTDSPVAATGSGKGSAVSSVRKILSLLGRKVPVIGMNAARSNKASFNGEEEQPLRQTAAAVTAAAGAGVAAAAVGSAAGAGSRSDLQEQSACNGSCFSADAVAAVELPDVHEPATPEVLETPLKNRGPGIEEEPVLLPLAAAAAAVADDAGSHHSDTDHQQAGSDDFTRCCGRSSCSSGSGHRGLHGASASRFTAPVEAQCAGHVNHLGVANGITHSCQICDAGPAADAVEAEDLDLQQPKHDSQASLHAELQRQQLTGSTNAGSLSNTRSMRRSWSSQALMQQTLPGNSASPMLLQQQQQQAGDRRSLPRAPAGAAGSAAGAAAASAPYDLRVVAHSLGGMSMLVYCVMRAAAGLQHRVDRLILMSPAGYHKKIPTLFWPFVLVLPWWHKLLELCLGNDRACECWQQHAWMGGTACALCMGAAVKWCGQTWCKKKISCCGMWLCSWTRVEHGQLGGRLCWEVASAGRSQLSWPVVCCLL